MSALHAPDRIRHAVGVVGEEIDRRLRDETALPWTESRLWSELSCCILSSQVPYALAQAASARLCESEILLDDHHCPEALESALVALLLEDLQVAGEVRRYRFPASRARQLARTWTEVHREGRGLKPLLEGFGDCHAARAWLVRNAPGLGPKQASMFLRNIGATYELAVLDRHVISYMVIMGLVSDAAPTRSMPHYIRDEHILRDHAAGFGLPVGLLDWAVWIVMRVASRRCTREASA